MAKRNLKVNKKLKPCPECWSKGKIKLDCRGGYYVEREVCGAATRVHNTKESAVKDWDDRKVEGRWVTVWALLMKLEAEMRDSPSSVIHNSK